MMVVSKIIKEEGKKNGGEIKGGYERGSYSLMGKAQISNSKNESTEYSLQENISYERFIGNLDAFAENISMAKSSIKPVLFIDEAQV